MRKAPTQKLIHGGWPVDEITALSSLALGVRLKAGDMSREFTPWDKPYGRPRAPAFRLDPVLLRGDRLVLPTICGTHSLQRS